MYPVSHVVHLYIWGQSAFSIDLGSSAISQGSYGVRAHLVIKLIRREQTVIDLTAIRRSNVQVGNGRLFNSPRKVQPPHLS